ncbi:uncharacterized protein LOC116180056 [Photinus pyralis]|uniref:uncharacterized protein LOC116180056 n=1 Tax=Photinus pyralis TaxID=7054 RepID=UPI0012672212|nr:uncharacterized protein LOC116180056 [Photinus pyralis]
MILKAVLIISVSTTFAFDSQKSTTEIFDAWKIRIDQEHPECAKTSGVSDEELDGLFRRQRLSSSRNFKCYLRCIHKVFNFVNDDGSLRKQDISDGVEKVSVDVLDFCMTGVGEDMDECEKSYTLVACMLRNIFSYNLL